MLLRFQKIIKNKINWINISSNPSIFTYDYQKIRKNFEELGEEIIAKALHPKRIFRLIEEYGEDEIYLNKKMIIVLNIFKIK